MKNTLIKILLFPLSISLGLLVLGCASNEISPWPEKVSLSYVYNGNALVLMSLEDESSKSITTIDTNRNLPYRQYDWSPDGERIAFITEGKLVVMAKDGRLKSLADNCMVPRWSPDGERIAYIEILSEEDAPPAFKENSARCERLAVFNLSTNEISAIAEGAISPMFDWTYDSSSIIYHNDFCYADTNERISKTLIQNINTGTEEWLFEGKESEAYSIFGCSPVLPEVMVGIWYGKDLVKLSLLDYESGMLEDLYTQNAIEESIWSPEGDLIAIRVEKSTQESGLNEIIVLDLEGRAIARLPGDSEAFSYSQGSGYNSEISWSSNGSMIIFSREYFAKPSVPDIYKWSFYEDETLPSGITKHSVERLTREGSNEYPQWNPGAE